MTNPEKIPLTPESLNEQPKIVGDVRITETDENGGARYKIYFAGDERTRFPGSRLIKGLGGPEIEVVAYIPCRGGINGQAELVYGLTGFETKIKTMLHRPKPIKRSLAMKKGAGARRLVGGARLS